MKKTYSTKNTRAYSNYVIKLLKEFQIICTKEQRDHIRGLPTQEAVNRYKYQIMEEVFDHA